MIILLGMRADVPRKEPKLRPRIVKTLVAQPGQKTSTVTGLGQVISAQPVDLYSEVSGTILAGDVPFQPAQSFKEGDLLLRIDDRQIRLDINSTKSDFLTALASALAEIKSDFPDEYEAWRDYFYSCDFARPIDPLPDAGDQRIQLLLARFSVYKLFYTIKDLEIILEKHNIYAPFDGSIVSANMRVGSTARNGSNLGQIINLEEMEVVVPITTNDIHWIKIGIEVSLKSEATKTEWHGTVSRIGSSINRKTQTIPVFIKVRQRKDTPLYSGIFLTVEIPGSKIQNAVTIPRQALYDGNQVYLIKEGVLEPRRVNIARKEFDSVIISNGLVAGDTVIIDLMQGVVPGIPVVTR
jgi:multidrug efflux pump subunit AcrA (membrane-fusion protein)